MNLNKRKCLSVIMVWVMCLLALTGIIDSNIIDMTMSYQTIAADDANGSEKHTLESIAEIDASRISNVDEDVENIENISYKIETPLQIKIAAKKPGMIKVIIQTTDVGELGQFLAKHSYKGTVGTSNTKGLAFPTLELPINLLQQIASLNSVVGVYEYQQGVISGSENLIRVSGGEGANSTSAVSHHRVDKVWDYGFNGSGVNVAVIDTGVDFAHPDLKDKWAVDTNTFIIENDTVIASAKEGDRYALVGSTLLSFKNKTIIEKANGGETYFYLLHRNIHDYGFKLYINDIEQSVESYTLNLTSGKITLTPPMQLQTNDAVIATYTCYIVERRLVPTTYKVYKNNILIDDGYALDLSTGNLTFTDELQKGDTIRVTYKHYSPYYGWPIAFDPASMSKYFSTNGDATGTWYVNTSYNGTGPFEKIHTIKVDGINDFSRRELAQKDDEWGDMENYEYDLSEFYATRDMENWYLGFTARSRFENMSFGIYIDTDGTASGSTYDPRGNYINTESSHADHINDIAISPDGKLIASASGGHMFDEMTRNIDNSIKIWTLDGELLHSFVETKVVRSIVFTSDSKILYSATSDRINAWDVNTGEKIREIIYTGIEEPPDPSEGVRSVISLSPDNKWLAVGAISNKVYIYNVTNIAIANYSGEQNRTSFSVGNPPRSVRFSPNGRKLAVGLNDGWVKIFNTSNLPFTPLLLRKVYGHIENRVESVSWSPDGNKVISGGRDNLAKTWDLPSWESDQKSKPDSKGSMDNTSEPIENLTDENDGKYYRVESKENLHIDGFNVSDIGYHIVDIGKFKIKLKVKYSVIDMDSSGSFSGSENIQVWSYKHDDWISAGIRPQHGQINVTREYELFSNTLLTNKEQLMNFQVRYTNKDTGSDVVDFEGIWVEVDTVDGATLVGHAHHIMSVDWSGDGTKIATASKDKCVKIWDSNGSMDKTLRNHTGAVYAVKWSPENNVLFSCSSDTKIKKWNVASSEEVKTFIRYLPDYALYIDHVGNEWGINETTGAWSNNNTIKNAVLYTWDGVEWVNTSLLLNGTLNETIGAQLSYSGYRVTGGFIEIAIPRQLIGDPNPINITLFTVGEKPSHAQDTSPSDANVAFTNKDLGSTSVTSLSNFALVEIGNYFIGLSSENSSKSGRYFYGVHPDMNLISEFGSIGILVVDSTEECVYDTIYINSVFDDTSPNEVFNEKDTILNINNGVERFTSSGRSFSTGLLYFIADGSTPIPYSRIYAERYGFLEEFEQFIPKNGELACLIGEFSYHGDMPTCHGTKVASAILNIAPDAKIIPIGDITVGNVFDALYFAVEGYDGNVGTGDEAQVTNIGVNYPEVYETGWDIYSRFADYVSIQYAKGKTILVAGAGNNGYGYGTLLSPASSLGVLAVGTATNYIYMDTEGSNYHYGQIAVSSARGPTAVGHLKPEVVAIGNIKVAIPTVYSGEYEHWFGGGAAGGSDASSAITTGILALIYNAYYTAVHDIINETVLKAKESVKSVQLAHSPVIPNSYIIYRNNLQLSEPEDYELYLNNGTLLFKQDVMAGDYINATYKYINNYPDVETARSIVMSGADNLNYDVLVQGAGFINAESSVNIAREIKGLVVTPSVWVPGNYRGNKHDMFTRIMYPGDMDSINFTLKNTGSETVNATATVQVFQRTNSFNISRIFQKNAPIRILVDEEGIYNLVDNNIVKVIDIEPKYWHTAELIKVTAHTEWSNIYTVAHQLQEEHMCRLSLYDINDRVNISDRTKWNTISESYNEGNILEARINNPHRKVSSGFVIDIDASILGGGKDNADWYVNIEFYNKTSWNWLSVEESSILLKGHKTTNLDVEITVPPDAPIGTYEGAVYLNSEEHAIINETIAYVPIYIILDEKHSIEEETAEIYLNHENIKTGSEELRRTLPPQSVSNESVYGPSNGTETETRYYLNHSNIINATIYIIYDDGTPENKSEDRLTGFHENPNSYEYILNFLIGEIYLYVHNSPLIGGEGEWTFGDWGPNYYLYAWYNYTSLEIISKSEYTIYYHSGKIIFDTPFIAGDIIYANYTYSPTIMLTHLNYSNIVPDSITIYNRSGTVYETNTYAVDHGSGTILFTSPLAHGEIVNATYKYYLRTTTIPILVNVGSNLPKFTFGGNVLNSLYDNSRVYGGFNTGDSGPTQRSGDWRYYFVDIPTEGLYGGDNEKYFYLYLNATWNNKPSDLDFFVFANAGRLQHKDETYDTARYGPYVVKNMGGSTEKTEFYTTTGENQEIIVTRFKVGLNVIAIRNILINGTTPYENITGEVGWIRLSSTQVNKVTNKWYGEASIDVMSNCDWPIGINASVVGPATAEKYKDLEVWQECPDDMAEQDAATSLADYFFSYRLASYQKVVQVESAATFEVHIWGDPRDDLDLGIFYDQNLNGEIDKEDLIDKNVCDFTSEYKWGVLPYAGCADDDSDEAVKLIMPPDGQYIIAVYGWGVITGAVEGKGAAALFEMEISLIMAGVEGYGIEGMGVDIAPETSIFVSSEYIPAFTSQTFNITWDFAGSTKEGEYGGILSIGPRNAPGIINLVASIVLDRTAPIISEVNMNTDEDYRVHYIDNTTTNDNTPTLSITISDVERGELNSSSIKLYMDGTDVTSLATINTPFEKNVDDVYGYWFGTIKYTPEIPLSEKGHDITVEVGDLAGNIATEHWTFTIDTQAPYLAIDTPSADISTNVNIAIISGTTTPDSTLFIRGKEIEVKEDGSFSKEERLEEGINEIPITAVDWFDWDDSKGLIPGNTATITRIITFDTTKPQFSRITTSTTSITNKDATTIIGKIEDERNEDVILTVNDILTAVNSDGTFIATLLLEEEGENEINIIATDPAGNTNETSMTIVKDTIKPILTIEALSPNTQGVLNIKGTTEQGVALTINGKPVPVVNGAFNKEIDLSYGANLIVIESKDAAGNVEEIREVVMYSSMPVIGFLPLSVISMIVLLLIGLFIGYVLLSRTKFGKRIEEEEVGEGMEVEEGAKEEPEIEKEAETEEEMETKEESADVQEEEQGEPKEQELSKEKSPEEELEELEKEFFGEE